MLVVWLVAAADGTAFLRQVQLVPNHGSARSFFSAAPFRFFLHLCGGIRHLVWDTGHGFELGTIYVSGWTVVGASTALTVITWITSSFLKDNADEQEIHALAARQGIGLGSAKNGSTTGGPSGLQP